jgi:PHD/YefM family antitoxin component YafN of YafNO toxin-antitoxin module
VNGRYVVDKNGKRVGVLLDIKEYERMVEELEELEDILAYREAKAALESGEDEAIPLEQAMREIREGKVKGDQ